MLELATKADRAAVNALAVQVHEMHVQWRPDLYCMPEALYPEERFSECIAKRQLYVAKLEDSVVGYVLIHMYDANRNGMVPRKVLRIEELVVHEAARGHGIGTEMMNDVRALAKAFGCTDLHLGVYPQNEGAIRFYESFGFMIRSIDMQKKV